MKKETPRRPWSRKTWKAIALSLISFIAASALLLTGLVLWSPRKSPPKYDRVLDGCDPGPAQPISTTKLNSWGNINQQVKRAEGWRQIVQTSSFQDTYPLIDGSTSLVPLAVEFARQHRKLNDEMANSSVYFSTTSLAYERLLGAPGLLDLFIGTAPGETDLLLARKNGVTLVQKPICWDSFIFITHKDNPVDSLNLAQLRGIFAGNIRNWNGVGGVDGEIRAFQREQGAGSQTGMEKLVMQGTPMASPEAVKVITGMGELVEAVAEPRSAAFGIGYTYAYYIENLYKNADIKVLRVNGIESTDANVISGTYPLSIERFGVIRKEDEQAIGGQFLDWILSAEGQACVKQAGYIPVAAIS